MHSAIFGNAEALRTQSCFPRISSALSASPRFKSSPSEIAEHGYVLTPARYVGAEEVEDDGVPFAEKMEGLTRELATQFHESENKGEVELDYVNQSQTLFTPNAASIASASV